MSHLIPQIRTAEYDYELPDHRIAQHPLVERDSSKLLNASGQTFTDDIYANLHQYLPANSLMVLNNSKVIPARIRYIKPSGGMIELFCLSPQTGTPEIALQQTQSVIWKCMIGGLKKWKTGSELVWNLSNVNVTAKIIGLGTQEHWVEFSWNNGQIRFLDILQELGQMPIPPYMQRESDLQDSERYQTVFADIDGSVAAPTAGLHFTNRLLENIQKRPIEIAHVTLHVGAGTFKPVKSEWIENHEMHEEWVEVDIHLLEKLIQSNEVICVGTTSLRSLESLYWYANECAKHHQLLPDEYILPQWTPYQMSAVLSTNVAFETLLTLMKNDGRTQLFFRTALLIVPGYTFKCCRYLVTNFHQPQSTLLMLVAAYTQHSWRAIYEHAMQHEYRFLSYGDGCLLKCA
ncbi:MAG TPA: S-adenosylmethionine:tRNA ribosyltransferase-isomerase, partial [Chitinophagaceae bacterium]|nr:S-adenosylmethionine:tRNA ribosyltransferase-isomerase [Chitinophagaceae bacterium]